MANIALILNDMEIVATYLSPTSPRPHKNEEELICFDKKILTMSTVNLSKIKSLN